MRTKKGGKPNTETYALSQHIYISAHKARRVMDQIRGRYYKETLQILELMPYQACSPILKLVSSAANASHNMGFHKAALVISQAEVNEGTTVKKFKHRARGHSSPIIRTLCHINIVLKEKSLEKEYSIIHIVKKKNNKMNINMDLQK